MKLLEYAAVIATLLVSAALCFGSVLGSMGFVFACCLLLIVRRRHWRALVAVGLAIFLSVSAADWLLLDRRLSVERRIYSWPFNTSRIVDVLRSPSGKTVAYVIGDYWIDTGHSVYLKSSQGILHGQFRVSQEGLSDAFYHRDINAFWEGERFAVMGQSDVFSYDEATGEISFSERPV